MAIILDSRGNEYNGQLDVITGQTVTDARVAAQTLGALNAESLWDLNGHATLQVDLRTAAGSLTLVFEGTIDGTNYIALPALNVATQAYVVLATSTTTFNAQFVINVAGFRRIRVRVSAYTSGNMTVTGRATTSDAVIQVERIPMTLTVTTTAAAAAICTMSLPLVAGLFHYINWIRIEHFATALLTPAAAPVIVTTTNLPGTPSFNFRADAALQGTLTEKVIESSASMRSTTAGTATTVVGPATTGVIWKITANYRLGY